MEKEKMFQEAHIRMYEDMIYRLYNGIELTTGQMNSLAGILTKLDPKFKKVKEEIENEKTN